MRKGKKGFTLIEVIAVIAIITILTAILVPNILSYIKLSEQTKIKNDAVTMVEIAYRQEASGGINFLGSKDPVRVLDLINIYNNGKYMGNSVSNPQEMWEELGFMTTLQQLIEISKMPVKDIPVKHGRLPQINDQAILN